ncbi:HAMP domain-containing protein [Streptomyces sp. NPDC101118]|uniref:HAMP domain-containing protein n=1 Tax=Streptomyces sp. NPDC101118 TaxID=3366109 RepID=UPI0037FCD4D0
MSLLGGIRPPIAALCAALLALAALTAIQFGRVGKDAVPEAVLTSQQHFAEDGAIALRASLDESITDLSRTANLFNAGKPVSADTVLDKLGNVYQKWRGTAVLEIKSGKLMAQRGENLPLTAIDRTTLTGENGLAPRMVRLANGETRLLTLGVLSWPGKPQQLLVASSSLKFPGVSLGKFRAIAVVDSSGQILSSDGADPDQADSEETKGAAKQSKKQLAKFAKTAARKAEQHPLKTKEPGAGGFPGVSGSLLGDSRSGERSVAGYATLAGAIPGEGTAATALGLTVVSSVEVTESSETAVVDPFFGIAAAGALLVIGAIALAVLVGTVQKPLLQLFLESRRLSRGDLTRPVTLPKYGEASRIGAALELLRRQLLGEPVEEQEGSAPERGRRGRIGMRALIGVCAALLLVWSAPLVLLINRADDTVKVPSAIVSDQRERTDTLADRVRRALNEGHADLTSVASMLNADTTPNEMAQVLERTRTEHTRYESLYVLQADGTVTAKAGSEPHHPKGKGPENAPVVLREADNKPVVTEYAEAPGLKGAAVVGELKISFLNGLLKRPGLGEIRVVDGKQRIVASSSGYRAFQELPDDKLKALVTAANQKSGKGPHASSVVHRDGDGVGIAAAAPFNGGGAAKPLNWTVVSWQNAKGLAIPEYNLQNRTVLAGLLGLTAVAACLGWMHIIVVRPLRQLAQRAEALADGDRRTVLFPTHHDEVGAVTRSLEVIRQQLVELKKREASGSAGRAGKATPAGRN